MMNKKKNTTITIYFIYCIYLGQGGYTIDRCNLSNAP